MLSILQVLHDYLPLHAGGSEIHAHGLALAMQRRGHRVTSLFTERDLSRTEGDLREGMLDGVRTIERVHQREYADVRDTWSDAKAESALARIVARDRPDVVHFHHVMGWGPGALSIAKELGARVVMTLHDYYALCDRATLLRRDGSICERGSVEACGSCLERHPLLARGSDGFDSPSRSASSSSSSSSSSASASASGTSAASPSASASGSAATPSATSGEPDAVARSTAYDRAAIERRAAFRTHFESVNAFLAPSRFLAELYLRAGMIVPETVELSAYGSSGEVFEPRTREPGTPLHVGYVGGVYHDKGVHVLVEAMRELERSDVELHVHGVLEWFPDYVAKLRERAQGLAITFHGGFAPRDVDRVYRSIDVLCVPSVWYENRPLAIQDAYRHGVPVIASDLGGLTELVPHEVAGLLFPAGDAQALSRAIARLADDPVLHRKLALARPSIASLDEIARRIEALYRGAAPQAVRIGARRA